MSFEYIRETYKVPANRGGRVRYKGKLGTIINVTGSYLMIRLDGESAKRPYHPTWEIEYLTDIETQDDLLKPE